MIVLKIKEEIKKKLEQIILVQRIRIITFQNIKEKKLSSHLGGLVKLVMLWTQLFSQQISQLLKWLTVTVYITNAHGPKAHKNKEARDHQRERERERALMSFNQSSYCLIISFDPFSVRSLSLKKKKNH